jgi:uncharacterized membrane protein YtjA (UPF0391 family)
MASHLPSIDLGRTQRSASPKLTCQATPGSIAARSNGRYGTNFSPRHYPGGQQSREPMMLNLVVTLLIIGLIAAVLGFGGIAGASFALAKVIFFVVLVLFLLSIVVGTVRRPLL